MIFYSYCSHVRSMRYLREYKYKCKGCGRCWSTVSEGDSHHGRECILPQNVGLWNNWQVSTWQTTDHVPHHSLPADRRPSCMVVCSSFTQLMMLLFNGWWLINAKKTTTTTMSKLAFRTLNAMTIKRWTQQPGEEWWRTVYCAVLCTEQYSGGADRVQLSSTN